jgi:UDP-N-acetylglucosamine--dolichyl-phosphate N-acetylglucosaminephosphotransferase
MVEVLLLVSFLVSFIITYVTVPLWIKAAERIRLKGRDMHSYKKREVPEMGGLAVNAGFIAGVLFYIGFATFYFNSNPELIYILAALATCLIIMIVGMLDDILGWRIGLRKWQKPLLTSIAALPMMAVNAGERVMALPLMGAVDFGILYPLLIVPLAVTGAANGFNMLAGFAGLEAGMGAIILMTLGFVAWQTGNGWVAVIALCMVTALLAFLRYNWHPARIFPGDTLTYTVGALIAVVAILGNMEKIALFLFIPYFLEFYLKLRTRFRGECFGKPDQKGFLSPPSRVESLTHLPLKIIRLREPQVVILLYALQFFVSAFTLILVF